MNRIVISGIILSILAFSCKKESDSTEECSGESGIQDDYMPLEIGNYWVYNYCIVDTLGVKDCGGVLDTITVVGTETINGINYFKLKRGGILSAMLPEFMRSEKNELFMPKYDDSTSNVIGEHLLFSNLVDTLESLRCLKYNWTPNCSYKIARYMESQENSVTLPYGVLEVRNSKELIISNVGWPFWGNSRTQDKQFTKGIGFVRGTAYFASDFETFEYELESYHLN